jgi:uncharacterized protein
MKATSRQEILDLLQEHQADLQRLGAKSLSLFGSVARDEAREDSDMDVLVEFDAPPTFRQYMRLKFYIEDLLGRKVDLVPERTLKPIVRPYVEREAIRVA